MQLNELTIDDKGRRVTVINADGVRIFGTLKGWGLITACIQEDCRRSTTWVAINNLDILST